MVVFSQTSSTDAPAEVPEASERDAPGFTPGPWYLDPANPLNVLVMTEFGPWLIAEGRTTTREGFMTAEHRQANARLIAAAPDLYSALKEARAALKDWLDVAGGCDHDVGICACADYRLLEKCDDAIARATEQPK